jgi:hypothetical protein
LDGIVWAHQAWKLRNPCSLGLLGLLVLLDLFDLRDLLGWACPDGDDWAQIRRPSPMLPALPTPPGDPRPARLADGEFLHPFG